MKNLQLILLNLLLCLIIFSCSSDDSDSNPETGSDTFSNTLTINERTFSPDSLIVTKFNAFGNTSLSFDIINRSPDDISKQEKLFIWLEFDQDSIANGTYTNDNSFESEKPDRVILRNTNYEIGTLNVIGQTKDYAIDNLNDNNTIKVIDHGDKVYTLEIDAYFEYEEQSSGSNPVEKERVHVKGVFKNKFKDFRDILGI